MLDAGMSSKKAGADAIAPGRDFFTFSVRYRSTTKPTVSAWAFSWCFSARVAASTFCCSALRSARGSAQLRTASFSPCHFARISVSLIAPRIPISTCRRAPFGFLYRKKNTRHSPFANHRTRSPARSGSASSWPGFIALIIAVLAALPASVARAPLPRAVLPDGVVIEVILWLVLEPIRVCSKTTLKSPPNDHPYLDNFRQPQRQLSKK